MPRISPVGELTGCSLKGCLPCCSASATCSAQDSPGFVCDPGCTANPPGQCPVCGDITGSCQCGTITGFICQQTQFCCPNQKSDGMPKCFADQTNCQAGCA
jgi:hypothetical protein